MYSFFGPCPSRSARDEVKRSPVPEYRFDHHARALPTNLTPSGPLPIKPSLRDDCHGTSDGYRNNTLVQATAALSHLNQGHPGGTRFARTNAMNQNTCCPWTSCLHTDPDGWECLDPIDCGTAPNHFKDKHGIANMGREVELVCAWQGCGCQVTRHNYIRHICGYHLKHDRVVGHANQRVIRLGG